MKSEDADQLPHEVRSAAPSIPPPAASEPAVPPATREFRLADVPPGGSLLVGTVAVFDVGGGLCATQASCTHRGGPLNEGVLEGSTVTCPWHGTQFNVCTGAVLRGPARESVKTYRVVVEGEVGRLGDEG